ncbi:biotin transporter BioY [Halohasta litorea]|uniref:Biotin transporter BioY n=1 Tax=Halohasta litorea TaxID=869891 RepID=A0ABD6D934_9EURY|nr:biotin transporter BioY [Halohasta litorea]
MATSTDSVDLVDGEIVGNIARAALFAALVAGFSYVSFPNPLAPNIPVTLQVVGVFLAGIMLGPLWGTSAISLYLAAGAIGVPVFSGGSAGLGYLIGSPTLGYLWSYPVAAGVVGLIVHRGTDLQDYTAVGVPLLVGAMVAGTLVIYAMGTVGFAVIQDLGLVESFTVSALAFVPFEAVKIAAVIGILRRDSIAAV